MHFTMFREKSVGAATLSKLYLGLDFVCDILEDEVRELPGVPVDKWKIHGVTAIPSGVYQVIAETSGRFGPETLTLIGVPGYKYIRIHGGNRSTDTEGCLLPGMRNGPNSVASSRDNLAKLKAMILPALKRQERVTIEIIPYRAAK
ncbi:DUF5675 family protein [Rhodoferax mekongensis]|uniref:DUF5675 family protein n=1 Tax=Rhodoferax mekongensis TaxID=3068341 RepID=A0ABZ0B2N9_9BURK|nr:DUF5675 family protein [Rhodoferax sp. TBRC 17307]WNO06057.1 DUF5675 family protein [Rhodoferax sp. TBRC 17307]